MLAKNWKLALGIAVAAAVYFWYTSRELKMALEELSAGSAGAGA